MLRTFAAAGYKHETRFMALIAIANKQMKLLKRFAKTRRSFKKPT